MTRQKRYTEYLQSQQWADLRTLKFEQAGRVCFNCGTANKLDVHHVNYRNLIDCTVDDLVVLCRSCHEALHAYLTRHKLKPHQVGEADIKAAISEPVTPKKQKQVNRPNRPVTKAKRLIRACKRAAWTKAAMLELISGLQTIVAEMPDEFKETARAKPAMVMPPAADSQNCIVLTAEKIAAMRTDRGGFSNSTLTAIGLRRSLMTHGWVKRLEGAIITQAQYEQALAGRTVLRTKIAD